MCSILLEPNNKLDDKTIEKIIQVFIRQLDDTTADTKGNPQFFFFFLPFYLSPEIE
jgi:hypothetical protein